MELNYDSSVCQKTDSKTAGNFSWNERNTDISDLDSKKMKIKI